ncbi:MAG TPA: sugar phosphate nucleotidyltransferase [Acidobacteriaceae bacterium]|jgi:NDP-sugar pyrophosphorylase family protein|nr:sugar phosphate nucleotidyltransferase [Acidobacteriaceae bacterium]
MNAPCAVDTVWPPRLALLAGGLATRLRPLTATIPKSLITVAGEPFLAHQLRRLRANGLRDIVICCGHMGDQIEAFVGDGRGFGLSIMYSHDGNPLLGTGGALRAALPLLGSRFLVMYGDSWLDQPIEPFWRAYLESGKPGLMSVFANANQWGPSNVAYLRGAVLAYNKARPSTAMHYIDYGLEPLDASVLAQWPTPAFDLSSVWSALADHGLLAGFETSQRFYEIGSLPGLRETEAVITAGLLASDTRFTPPPPPDAQAARS